jgi:hypothetical protein
VQVVAQNLDEILASLSPLKVEWQDEIAKRVIARLEDIPVKKVYSVKDVQEILDWDFNDGLLICRLFLALSKDDFTAAMRAALNGQIGITRYRSDRERFLDALVNLGILEGMALNAYRTPKWSDVLVERLRSGRGSAISGQKRGRGVEDFAERLVKNVFGTGNYAKRCTFTGARGKTAKCDFAIPSKISPRIVIEAKGYGATGSKMTDVIGDIEKIIAAKRPDTSLLFFTDGLTWNQRKSDLRKIVDYQNAGDITRIYTSTMASQFEADLRQLKSESAL